MTPIGRIRTDFLYDNQWIGICFVSVSQKLGSLPIAGFYPYEILMDLH